MKLVIALRLLLIGLVAGLVAAGRGQDFTTNGLIAYYPFDGNVNDATSNALNGVASAITYTTNRFGFPTNALLLNGSSSAVGIPYSTNFNFANTGQFTLAAWFRLNGYGSGSDGIGSLVVKSPVSGDWDFGMETGLNYGRVLWAGQNNEYACIATNQLALGTWYQSALTYSNGNWSLYLNGALMSQAVTGYKITQSVGGLGIGRKGDAGSDCFNGAIDDVRIYNRALPANEVSQLYALESNGQLTIASAIELDFFAVSGVTYQIQNSSDFTRWANVGMPLAGNGQLIQQFYSTHGTNGPYYRAIVLP